MGLPHCYTNSMKNILALLADVANGLFAVLLAGTVFSVEPVWWHFLIGIVFAFAPDIDALPELLARGRVSASSEHVKDHRTFLHYPTISIPLGVALTYLFGYWGFLWCLAVLFHLANDLYGTGWGIALLWPISTTRMKFLGRRVNRQKQMLIDEGDWTMLSHDERRLRLIVTWSAVELPSYIMRWGVDR